ncbi:hypothetical protein BDZ45DRAFT_754373 [Acephala macrosclerotiorum]|nr:hypothetical protein BDZ45DRAFT_754373 [Acephala macrosclerotiorum]
MSAPQTIVIGGHTCINVPMLYVAYLSSITGYWERYNCTSGTKPTKQHGYVSTKDLLQLGTSNLATCMDINLISKNGAMKIHVPPYISPFVPGYQSNRPKTQEGKDARKALKAAWKAMFNKHGSTMGRVTVEVVTGYAARKENVRLVLQDLLGDMGFSGEHHDIVFEETEVSGTTRVDLGTKPPTFFIQERPTQISVPS